MSERSSKAVQKATAFEKTVLPNGLTVLVHPMPGFTGVYALYGTRFGSIDRSFVLDGKRWDLPAGVAHFLEHKMFEMGDSDVMELFSRMGASVNAFTSYTETAYYFSTTSDVKEPLNLLLDFVQELDISEESVEKEKGIIIQELHMYKEMSDSRLLMEIGRAHV